MSPRIGCLIAVYCASLLAVGAGPSPQISEPSRQQFSEAQRLLAEGSVEKSVSLLRELAKASPDDADVHLLLGSALALIPLRSESIAALGRAAELRPTAPVFNTLGMALARFGEYSRARKALEEAIRLDPKLADAHLNLGLLLAGTGEFSSAYDRLSEAIKLNKDSSRTADLHYLRGKTLIELGKPAEAIDDLRRATKLRPDHAGAQFQLGMALRSTQDHAEAVRALTKAAELDPKNPTARYHLALEYLDQDKPEQAARALEQARRLLPDDRGIVLNLARALQMAGRTDEARDMRKELSRMASARRSAEEMNRAAQLNAEGVELEKSGNTGAALDKYREALDIHPENVIIRRNYGLVLCRLDRWKEGIAELRGILDEDPDDLDTRRILQAVIEQAVNRGIRVTGPTP